MLGEIIRKEILENISSPKFVSTFILCAVLILLSVYVGINNYKAELREYSVSAALNKKNLESQPNYSSLAGIGMKISKPPQVLSIITTGIQEAVGRQATVNIAYDPNLVESKYDGNPALAIFGELDLTVIIKIVLSLFALLFTYNAIVGEKERGTLKLTLSNYIPRTHLILGKAIGSFISILVPPLIPFVISMILLAVYPGISLTSEDWMRIGMIFSLFILYLMVFCTLGLFISARSSSSSGSLFILLFIWVIFIFVIPKGAVMTAGWISPIPSVHEITAQKDAFLQEIQGSAPQQVQKWIKENPAQSTPDYQNKFRKFLEDYQQEVTAKIDAKNSALERDYQIKRHSQQSLAYILSRISPVSTLSFGAMSLGKTGPQEHERFLNSIKTYKPSFTKWVNAKMMKTLNFGGGAQPKPDIGDMPRHSFKPESLQDSLMLALPDFVIMTLMVLVFFAGAFVSFLRYDVR